MTNSKPQAQTYREFWVTTRYLEDDFEKSDLAAWRSPFLIQKVQSDEKIVHVIEHAALESLQAQLDIASVAIRKMRNNCNDPDEVEKLAWQAIEDIAKLRDANGAKA